MSETGEFKGSQRGEVLASKLTWEQNEFAIRVLRTMNKGTVILLNPEDAVDPSGEDNPSVKIRNAIAAAIPKDHPYYQRVLDAFEEKTQEIIKKIRDLDEDKDKYKKPELVIELRKIIANIFIKSLDEMGVNHMNDLFSILHDTVSVVTIGSKEDFHEVTQGMSGIKDGSKYPVLARTTIDDYMALSLLHEFGHIHLDSKDLLGRIIGKTPTKERLLEETDADCRSYGLTAQYNSLGIGYIDPRVIEDDHATSALIGNTPFECRAEDLTEEQAKEAQGELNDLQKSISLRVGASFQQQAIQQVVSLDDISVVKFDPASVAIKKLLYEEKSSLDSSMQPEETPEGRKNSILSLLARLNDPGFVEKMGDAIRESDPGYTDGAARILNDIEFYEGYKGLYINQYLAAVDSHVPSLKQGEESRLMASLHPLSQKELNVLMAEARENIERADFSISPVKALEEEEEEEEPKVIVQPATTVAPKPNIAAPAL